MMKIKGDVSLCVRLAKVCRVLALALAVFSTAAQGAPTFAIFDTGTTVDLRIALSGDTIVASDVRGLAGVVVTSPPIPDGVVIGDFGQTTPPSDQLLGVDAATLTQILLFQLNVTGLTVGGPGVLVPVGVTPLTGITDPALQQMLAGLIFGFAPVGSEQIDDATIVTFNLVSVQSAIPEPASMALVAGGLVAVAVVRRRRTT